MSYAGYTMGGRVAAPRHAPSVVEDYVTPTPDTFQGAAFAVGFMLVASVLFLTILKRSGFRAMVAVGRS